MPWTFAHPAAILPLRRRLPLDALVAGSVVPDLAYYLDWPAIALPAHALAGVATIDLPAGLALVAAWRLLRAPVAHLLPARWRERLGDAPSAASPARAWVNATAAVVAGALTHLAWDSFTHARGWIVQHVDVLRAPLGHVGDHGVPVFNLLQHGSTLAGVVALGLVLRDGRRTTPRDDVSGDGWRRVVLAGIVATSVVAAIAWTALAGPLRASVGVSAFLAATVGTVVRATDLAVLGIVATALACRRRP